MRSPKAGATLAPLWMRGDSGLRRASLSGRSGAPEACREQAGSGPACSGAGSRDRADHLADLVVGLTDLLLGDEQGRRQDQRVADGPQHDVMVVERAVDPGEAALAHLVRQWRQIDAGGETNGADIDHVGL